MRPTPIHKSEAFTLSELILVLVVLAIVFGVVAMMYPLANLRSTRAEAYRIRCINNLKQIGAAYRLWANDHNDHYPASVSVADGGWMEFLIKPDQGSLCWTNYAIMANEFGRTNGLMPVDFPKGLVCPSDEREPAGTFTNFANANLSYFVGVSASEDQPQSLLGGDRNLGAGIDPSNDYGFSPKNGKGNDVAIQTNSNANPICWSLKMHSLNPNGTGNILLGDCSVQQVQNPLFRLNWQSVAGQTTNWPAGHVPSSPSIRVLFP